MGSYRSTETNTHPRLEQSEGRVSEKASWESWYFTESSKRNKNWASGVLTFLARGIACGKFKHMRNFVNATPAIQSAV